MAERPFSGKPEPTRAVRPEQTPTTPFREAPPPLPLKEVPPPKRPSKLKKAGVVGLTAALLGTGGLLGTKALENIQSRETPHPSTPLPTEHVKPTPTKEPPAKPPKIKIKSTGELLWGNKDAHLGILGEQVNPGNTFTLISGILTNVSREKLIVNGKRDEVYTITLALGRDKAFKFILGRANDNVYRQDMVAESVPYDTNAVTDIGYSSHIIPAEKVAEYLSKRLGHQYFIPLLTSLTNPAPDCASTLCNYLFDFISNNNRISEIIRSKTQSPQVNIVGAADEIYIPLDARLKIPIDQIS